MRSICAPLLAALLWIPLASAQTTRYVWTNSPSPGSPFTNWDTAARSIQEAIDASIAGDTVVATDGVYFAGGRPALGMALTNRVLITNAITLRSVNGPLASTIRGQGPVGFGAVRGVLLTNGATLSGFLVENGRTLGAADIGAGPDKSGAGVLAFADCTVTNCHLNDNTAAEGGGGFFSAGGFDAGDMAFLLDCLLERNTAANGGGAYLFSGVISNSTFRNNTALTGFGGGAYAVNADVNDCLFVGNTAAAGGGLALAGQAARITAISNQAAVGGGVYAGEAFLQDIQLVANSATTNGGGAFLETCWLIGGVVSNNDLAWGGGAAGTAYGAGIASVGSRIVGCSIDNNHGHDADDQGGGVACYPAGTWTNELIDCDVRGNSAGDGGGIFVLPYALCELSTTGTNGCDIRGNAATNYGGGACTSTQAILHAAGRIVFAANDAANGGGLAARAGAQVVIEESNGYVPIFYDNSATNSGGGLFAAEADTLLSLRDVQIGKGATKIQGNIAYGDGSFSGGGGIALYGGASLLGTNLVVEYNRCPKGHGGGLLVHYAQADVYSTAPPNPANAIPLTVFAYNRATNSSKNGGGIYLYASRLSVQEAIFYGNSANRGGAIHVNNGSTGRLDNVVVAGNTAGIGGGIRVSDSALTNTVCDFRHCTVYGNTTSGVSVVGAARVSLTNCIVYSNAGTQVSAGHTVACSDIEGGYGAGNIDADPRFRNPTNRDFHLTLDSVTVVSDTGIDAGLTNDCVFRARAISFGFDMGAYEYEIDRDDSDGDGIPDQWENIHGLDPRNSADGPAHSDADGIPNDDEYLADTDPLDEGDFFHLNECYYDPVRPWHGIRVGFPSSAERQYSLYYTEALSNDCVWAAVPGQSDCLGGGAPFDGLNDTNAPGIATDRIYRVTVHPIPE